MNDTVKLRTGVIKAKAKGSLKIDATLTKEGQAADAKSVGDKVTELDNKIKAIFAEDIAYDNESTKLEATNVQDAIDKIASIDFIIEQGEDTITYGEDEYCKFTYKKWNSGKCEAYGNGKISLLFNVALANNHWKAQPIDSRLITDTEGGNNTFIQLPKGKDGKAVFTSVDYATVTPSMYSSGRILSAQFLSAALERGGFVFFIESDLQSPSLGTTPENVHIYIHAVGSWK